MTPEEILAECQEYFVLDWVRKSPTIYKERGTGRDVNPKEVEKIATSRKEARELREKNAKLVKVLEDSETWIEGDAMANSGLLFGESNALDLIQEALEFYRSNQNA